MGYWVDSRETVNRARSRLLFGYGIAQFIGVVVVPGKMDLQFLSGHGNARYDPLFEISFFECSGNGFLGGVPKILGDCSVYARSPTDHKLSVLHRYIEQYAVVLLGIVHFKVMEQLLGPVEGVQGRGRLNMDTDFPRSVFFGLYDGLHDLRFVPRA